MNLTQLDLNSLQILKQLIEEKHVSNTALSLNISQSSVSRALQKMRSFFDDELLVRSNYGYELTPKAESLKEDLTEVITSLERLVHKQQFSPDTIASTVKFYGLQPQIDALMPAFIEKVRCEAPNLVVSIDTTPKRHFNALIAGDIHFVMSSHEPPTGEQNIHRMILAKRDFRLLMSKSHPLADKALTTENLMQSQFGQISLQGEKNISFEAKFRELGYLKGKESLNVPVQLSNFNSAPNIAAGTDIIFHLPTPFALAACKDDRLCVKEIPKELQLDFQYVYLYWHKRFHDDPMCEWVRGTLKSLFSEEKSLA
ncbi:LysR family transcriptional regulator [Pseudoalteromonas sp. SCSIO 43201]|uniref:LysR family transcriptional regulator n=1 Tax=Pseudoalteromonas TaxID=53246 RepID=UPI00207602CE|nr:MULTISPECIES: LysR family transcriptional regulator [Pseudoalteromonas]MDW7547417.1 LysR family transcriptional regulator [Pseudoalteromonas peptidolytica]USD27929.1 LysR family transcriptional regulator [Pseudoalteromonas sp. SCSIO 43201]